MKISVIVPTYQCRKSLDNLIDSLALQSFQDFELIIVSNSANENDFLFVQNLVQDTQLANIKVVNAKANLGPGGGRNFGVEHTSGEILAFIDDDCLAHENWLLEINKEFKNKESKIIFGPVDSAVSPFPPFIHSFDMTGDVFGAGNFAVKRDFFVEIGMFDTFLNNWSEDYELYKRCLSLGVDPKYIESMKVNHPPKIVPYQLKNHLISKEFVKKYYYITEVKGYSYKMPFLKNLIKTGFKKLLISLVLIGLGLYLGCHVLSLLFPFLFFALFQLKKYPELKRKLKAYPYESKFNYQNYLFYVFFSWVVDILNLFKSLYFQVPLVKKKLSSTQ